MDNTILKMICSDIKKTLESDEDVQLEFDFGDCRKRNHISIKIDQEIIQEMYDEFTGPHGIIIREPENIQVYPSIPNAYIKSKTNNDDYDEITISDGCLK